MAQSEQRSPTDIPHEDFVEQVKGALEHLYDLPALQRHPLTQGGERTGQELRRALIGAIEGLCPEPNLPFRAPHARLYNLLHLHYMEGRTVQEAANELGLSLRQAYRDLRRAEENIAAILWGTFAPVAPQEPAESNPWTVQAEIARLEPRPRPIEVQALLQHAQRAVERLATQRSVALRAGDDGPPALVSADPAVAQQVFVSLLSSAVQQAEPGPLVVEIVPTVPTALSIAYAPACGAPDLLTANPAVAQILERLGWSLRQEESGGGQRRLLLQMGAFAQTVLVIDDNQELVELLERYLTGQSYRVVSAGNGKEGLQLAQVLDPDVVILDVMMPEIDGWEVLQTLRTRSQTRVIPVIICSVFNDPELAYSLGASAFVAKPITQEAILKALRQVHAL